MNRNAIGLAAISVLIGCGRSEPVEDRTPLVEWPVESEPMFVVGGDEDAADPLFRIAGVARVSGGYIVANAGAGEVRFYADDGRLVRIMGRQGSGPGEFRAPRLAGRLSADSIVVADGANRRVAIICEAERVCDEWQLPAAGNAIGIAGDRVILGEVLPDLGTAGLTYDRHRFFIAERRGAGLDTIHEFDATPRFVRRIDGRLISMPVPFSRPASIALVGDRIVFGNGRDATIWVIDLNGGQATQFELPVPVVDVGPDEFDAEIERRLENADAGRRALYAPFYADMPRPAHRSPLQRIVADRTGLIWAELDDSPPGSQAWLVADPAGRVIARVETPADLLVAEIGADYIVGVWRDELDVEYVRSYGLVRQR